MGSGTSIQQVPNSLGSVETTKTARPSVSDSGIDLELSKSMSSIGNIRKWHYKTILE